MSNKALVLLGWGVFSVFVLGACASHPCREPEPPKGLAANTGASGPAGVAVAELDPTHTFISKSDGSKQCGAKGTPLEIMESELKGLPTFSRSRKNDGKMRIQMCGADTGWFNIYEIELKDLQKAKRLGFQEWKKPE